MTYKHLSLFIIIASLRVSAQTPDSFRRQIQEIISAKNVVVGVAIVGNNGQDTLSINGERRFPMQSVFKFHIALAVLSQIDKGKLSLDQKIRIDKKDLLPFLYSPIRDQYPNGATLTISRILKYTVSESDNVGCEILLGLIGGAKVVEDYFVENGFKDVSVKHNEQQQQANWALQFDNWTTPKSANEILAAFFYNKKKLLSKKAHAFIWKTMKETTTGQNRLKGRLPQNTVVAHKTGSSGANKEGITAAVNDIGIVFLPNGQHYFISVFVANSTENADTNERVIADISRAAWDYFMTKPK